MINCIVHADKLLRYLLPQLAYWRQMLLINYTSFFHKRKLSATATAERDKSHESLAKRVA